MLSYPMQFKVSSRSESGIQTLWKTRSEHQPTEITMAIPPEFAGPGGGFSPEDIYAMALSNCFIATFKVFAEKSRLNFKEIIVQTNLSVDRNEKGFPWMAKIHLNVNLSGVTQKENALKILDKTSQGCMILNSVLTTKTFDFNVTE